jgi:choline kinase
MKAIMLAAGVGSRLVGESGDHPPKILLKFGGKTLLQRHVESLRACGITELTLVVGYQADQIVDEINRIGARDMVRTIFNDRFREGNIISLWYARQELEAGEDVLLMDGDVLYDIRILDRLINSDQQNAFLVDRDFEQGDEPVKLCIRDDAIVEFRKWLSAEYDWCGESVGFFRFSPAVAAKLVEQTRLYVENNKVFDWYEEALRDILLTGPRDRFGWEDITGLPWIEIDFPEDVEKASSEILPAMQEPDTEGARKAV